MLSIRHVFDSIMMWYIECPLPESLVEILKLSTWTLGFWTVWILYVCGLFAIPPPKSNLPQVYNIRPYQDMNVSVSWSLPMVKYGNEDINGRY